MENRLSKNAYFTYASTSTAPKEISTNVYHTKVDKKVTNRIQKDFEVQENKNYSKNTKACKQVQQSPQVIALCQIEKMNTKLYKDKTKIDNQDSSKYVQRIIQLQKALSLANYQNIELKKSMQKLRKDIKRKQEFIHQKYQRSNQIRLLQELTQTIQKNSQYQQVNWTQKQGFCQEVSPQQIDQMLNQVNVVQHTNQGGFQPQLSPKSLIIATIKELQEIYSKIPYRKRLNKINKDQEVIRQDEKVHNSCNDKIYEQKIQKIYSYNQQLFIQAINNKIRVLDLIKQYGKIN